MALAMSIYHQSSKIVGESGSRKKMGEEPILNVSLCPAWAAPHLSPSVPPSANPSSPSLDALSSMCTAELQPWDADAGGHLRPCIGARRVDL